MQVPSCFNTVKPPHKGSCIKFNSLYEVEKFIQEDEVELIDFVFVDPCGRWNHITYAPSQCSAPELAYGYAFDGSSVRLFGSIDKSDMLLRPDYTRGFIDPFSPRKTLLLICNVCTAEGESFPRCPRTIATKAANLVKKLGIAEKVVVGPELEFFVFDHVAYKMTQNEVRFEVDAEDGGWQAERIGAGNMGHRVGPRRGYLPVAPIDQSQVLRGEMLLTLEEIGIPIEKHHHECATCQHELGIKYDDLVSTADNMMLYKYVVKNVARLHNKTATFMPKPMFGDNGSGMHVHQSLWGRSLGAAEARLAEERHAAAAAAASTTTRTSPSTDNDARASDDSHESNPHQSVARVVPALKPSERRDRAKSVGNELGLVNLFYSEVGTYHGLSSMALYYIGGILKHAPAILAFTNPSTNSYKRLVPGFEAPTHLVYSKGNRSAAVRIPLCDNNDPKAKRLECRFPDGSSCPYLAFSALLLAGIDGIVNKIHPPLAVDENMYESKHCDVPTLPASLEDALTALEADHEFLIKDSVFPLDFIKTYIKLKREEVSAVARIPHPKEYDLYYNC